MDAAWLLAGLCLLLTAGLWWALAALFTARRAAPDPALAGSGPVPLGRLDELLTMLLALHEYGASRAGTVSHQELCSLALDQACRLVGSTRGTAMLHDPETGLLCVIAARSAADETPPQLSLKPGEGVAGRAFAAGRPLYVPAPADDQRYVAKDGAWHSEEPVLAVPMLLGSQAVGVLNIHDTAQGAPPDEVKLRFLSLLAGEAALALHHQRLYDDQQVFFLDMVQMLSRAVDAKDLYKQDRSDEARRLAAATARALGLPDQMVRYVEYAMMLHGIGKMGIDQALLSKPGKLTAEEFEQVKKHTTIGHRILARVRFLGPVAKMVLYHQEWYNGKGYPEGLRGEEIPLGSRIVAVVNAWEAMLSDRPYRKALTREAAMGELSKGAGAQFDPKVVDAFLKAEERAGAAA
ncbi:MAG: GAF domain-containing protein [Elusimicrobia bacterium]|nr:GAF domain-containing protein [Elusimicrobiota bacterium]